VTPERLAEITSRYRRLRVCVVGDVALDRYLHIDPSLREDSLETGLPVRNVIAVRPQPGGAGNVLANAVALEPARVQAVGFCGDDGEGYELRRCLKQIGVDTSRFIARADRMTFTYTKPLLMHPDRPPEELNRLDIRSRTPTPDDLQDEIIAHLRAAVAEADAVVAMDQVPEPGNGVVCSRVRDALAELAGRHAGKVFIADSRMSIGEFRGVRIKINRQELFSHFDTDTDADAESLALRRHEELGQDVFVTLSGEGIIAASEGAVRVKPGIPVSPPIDVTGAGDTVLANIALALAAGASAYEAAEIGDLAGSVVVRKIGTTGTATVAELREALTQMA